MNSVHCFGLIGELLLLLKVELLVLLLVELLQLVLRQLGRAAGGSGGLLLLLLGGGGGKLRGHPRMLEDLLQLDAVAGADSEAAADQVLALVGQTGAELDLGHADLLVLLEGDVAADHVVQQDAQRPDGGWVAMVPRAADPLRRSVHSRTCK